MFLGDRCIPEGKPKASFSNRGNDSILNVNTPTHAHIHIHTWVLKSHRCASLKKKKKSHNSWQDRKRLECSIVRTQTDINHRQLRETNTLYGLDLRGEWWGDAEVKSSSYSPWQDMATRNTPKQDNMLSIPLLPAKKPDTCVSWLRARVYASRHNNRKRV